MHTIKYKYSEWNKWHEAKSGRPNLRAAQMIVTREQFWQ